MHSTTRQLIGRLFAALDYRVLAEIYCDEGGEAFWSAHRDPVQTLGEVWADALAARLSRAGRSLYVGAGVAELPALAMEVSELEREVVVTSVDPAECATLNDSLGAVGLRERIRFECVDGGDAARAHAGYDHLSIVSVLNDPERYPVVSGLAYGRTPPVLLDVDAFGEERTVLRRLVAAVLRGLRRPGWITTTFEEVAWLLAGGEELSLRVEADAADAAGVETALVGDPIGFLRVT